MPIINSKDAAYQQWPSELKSRVKNSQLKAALSVNSELVMLYWHIGTSILEQQAARGWGVYPSFVSLGFSRCTYATPTSSVTQPTILKFR